LDLAIHLIDRPVQQQVAAFDDPDRRAAVGKLGQDVAGDTSTLEDRSVLDKLRGGA